MKLLTHIKPRTTGEVVAIGATGGRYVFKPDAAGLLIADVASDADVTFFLGLPDRFEPAEESDFERAEALLEAAKAQLSDDATDDIDFNDDPDAPLPAPLEANTPPVTDDETAPAKAAAKKGGRRARG